MFGKVHSIKTRAGTKLHNYVFEAFFTIRNFLFAECFSLLVNKSSKLLFLLHFVHFSLSF